MARITCPLCSTENRVPAEARGKTVRCRECRHVLDTKRRPAADSSAWTAPVLIGGGRVLFSVVVALAFMALPALTGTPNRPNPPDNEFAIAPPNLNAPPDNPA